MAIYVLVPGFWLGGWAWDAVGRELRAAGHEVRPVTLTGMGDRAGEASPEVDLETHVADVIEAIGDATVILVGHSYGGMPVAVAADRVPERVAHAVYVESGPLPDGSRQFDMHAPQEQARIEKLVAAEGDGWRLPPPPFAGDPVQLDGLSEDDLALLRERSVPQPFATALGQVRRPRRVPVPETLIACTIPEPQARRMLADGHPMFAGFGDGPSIIGLPTGHYPMFSRPADTARALASLA